MAASPASARAERHLGEPDRLAAHVAELGAVHREAAIAQLAPVVEQLAAEGATTLAADAIADQLLTACRSVFDSPAAAAEIEQGLAEVAGRTLHELQERT